MSIFEKIGSSVSASPEIVINLVKKGLSVMLAFLYSIVTAKHRDRYEIYVVICVPCSCVNYGLETKRRIDKLLTVLKLAFFCPGGFCPGVYVLI